MNAIKNIYIVTSVRGIVLLLGFFLMASCEDFLQIDPPDSDLIRETVFTNDETANAAVTAIYHQMVVGFSGGDLSSVTMASGRSADELTEYSATATSLISFFQNELLPTTSNNSSLWSSSYNRIYMANAVLEGLENGVGVTPEVRSQLEGEAKFIRAFCHFYLVNLYGDVPLVTTTDFRVNSVMGRTSSEQIYEQIITDLEDARELLRDDYSVSGGERTRPNKSAAAALLARVYLYTEDWTNAELYATEVIGNALYRLLPDLNQVFLANSDEAIWQILPVNENKNTNEGFHFILTSPPTSSFSQSSAALREGLVNVFEVGDQRIADWTASFNDGTNTWVYPFKYKVKTGATLTEYSMVMRLAEQYLLRAEARARQGGDLTNAISDLDVVRNRAGLPLIQNTNPNISQSELLDAILHERRVELFTEWGHRWLDLKRTGRANTVLSPVKPNWDATDVLYPIPEQDLLRNPNLRPQNDGY